VLRIANGAGAVADSIRFGFPSFLFFALSSPLTCPRAQHVLEPGKPWVVKFFAPWCGHCKSMAADYEKVAAKVGGLVGVGSVDCDQEKELCGAMQVKGFPTLKLFGPDIDKKGKKDPVDYQGARTTGAIANAVLGQLHSKNIKTAKKDSLDALLKDKKVALLFAAKPEPSNMLMALSLQFGKRLQFVLITEKEGKEAAAKFGVTSFPTLVVTDNGALAEVYKGKPTAEDMTAFLEKFAVPKPKKAEPPPPPSKVEYDKKVEQITTQEQWEGKCNAKAGFCGVAMLDPDEEGSAERHARFVAVLDEVLQKVYKNVRVMWVNGPQQSHLVDQFRLGGGFPAFGLYQPKLKRVVPYRGTFSTADILEWIENKVLVGRPQSFEVAGELKIK
jgi:protein disulfide-isomerase A6